MTGLINLISEYSKELTILPIIVLMNVIITVLIEAISKKTLYKYIPSLILGIVSLVIAFYAFSIFTTKNGLDISRIAVFLGSAALVGLFVSFIIDLLKSLRNDINQIDDNGTKKQNKINTKNTNKSTKTSPVKKATKTRKKRKISEKPKEDSKYITKKIKKINEDNIIKGSKKNKILQNDIENKYE